VVAMLESIFISAGIRCAAFTSPHLQLFNERIRVDGEHISDEELVTEVNELETHLDVLKALGHECTFFEAINAMALSYFRKKNVEIVLLETGLGGRLDSTNIVDPLISIITSIGLDHQGMLGETLEQIAAEKAGIIKPGKPVVTGEIADTCMEVIYAKATECSSEVVEVQEWQCCGVDPVLMTRQVQWKEIKLQLGLVSSAQVKNAATVYAVVEWMRQNGWSLEDAAVARGFLQVRWPGRFQRIHREPDIILDGAHNAAALDDLKITWCELYSSLPDTIAFGCLREKLTPEFCEVLVQIAAECQRIIILPVEDERTASSADIRKVLNDASGLSIESGTVRGVIDSFLHSQPEQRFLIFGSLYLTGEVLAAVEGDPTQFQPELNG
ncbi:MAG: Mur ligase family protein, partial [Verrucomicrobiota bacterium]